LLGELFPRPVVVVWLTAICALGLLQPVLLGFYLDDWSLIVKDAGRSDPFSMQLWRSAVGLDPTRPVANFLRWFLPSLLRDVRAVWHLALVMANFIISCQLAILARLLLASAASIPMRSLVPLAAAWMTLPWSSGFRYWPIFLHLHLYFIVLLWLAISLLRAWRVGRSPMLVPFLAYLAICLGYEALYMQFLVVGIIGLAEVRYRGVAKRIVARSISALLLAQACALAWNFLARKLFPSGRSIYPDWLPLLLRNLKLAVPEMIGSFGPARWIAAPAFAILIAGVALAIWHRIRSRSIGRAELPSVAIHLLAFAAGAFLSAVVFSFGARSFSGFGVEGRGLSVISLWATAGMVLIVGLALSHAAGFPGHLLKTGLWLSAFSLLAGQLMHLRNWHEAARLQALILSRVPVAEMLAAEPSARIVCVFPGEVGGAPVFSATWDLNSAIHVSYPALSRIEFLRYNPWAGALRWDGKQIWHEYFPEEKQSAEALYLWRPFYGEFRKLERPFIMHSDMQWQYID
jgi:hypothetical protein